MARTSSGGDVSRYVRPVLDLEETVDQVAAETGFSGVVRVDRDGGVVCAAYGLAHRGWSIRNTPDTRFGIASGTKPSPR